MDTTTINPMRRTVRMTAEVERLYRDSIARHPPETVALLGGRLDDPFLISEFRFLPPRRLAHGGYDASRVHVNVDHELMNWVDDTEWRPAGKDMVGIWHSQPGGLDRPSRGDAATNEGDEAFFAACLANDDSPGRAWRYFLAPITTFDASCGDLVHGWLMERGRRRAERCDVMVVPRSRDEVAEETTGLWGRPSGSLAMADGDRRRRRRFMRWRGSVIEIGTAKERAP